MPADIASVVPWTFVQSHRDSVRESALPSRSRDSRVVVADAGSAPHAGYGSSTEGVVRGSRTPHRFVKPHADHRGMPAALVVSMHDNREHV